VGAGGVPPPLKLGSNLPRGEGEDQLMATGLDVDELASESFKPEDCESYCFAVSSRVDR